MFVNILVYFVLRRVWGGGGGIFNIVFGHLHFVGSDFGIFPSLEK